jgi:hypothetical protein
MIPVNMGYAPYRWREPLRQPLLHASPGKANIMPAKELQRQRRSGIDFAPETSSNIGNNCPEEIMARRKKLRQDEEPQDFLDSRLFRFATRVFVGLVVVVLFLTLAQCTVRKPEMPEWTTTLTVPVVKRTYPMSELIDRLELDGLEVRGDSLVYSFHRTVDTIRLEQSQLAIDDIDTALTRSLGSLHFLPGSVSANTTVPGIGEGWLDGEHHSFFLPCDIPVISSFSTATVASGEVEFLVINQLNYHLDTVAVTLWDVADMDSVLIDSQLQAAPGINHGDSGHVLLSLAGQTISNELRLQVYAATNSYSSAGGDLTTTINFTDSLVVTAATDADVPSIALSDTTFVSIFDSGNPSLLYDASLSGGTLELTITNNTPLTAVFTLVMPELLQGSQPLVVQRSIDSAGVRIINIPLAGYRLVPTDQIPEQNIVIIQSVITHPDTVDVLASQDFSVQASLSSVTFGSATGVFSAAATNVSRTVDNIATPEGFDGIGLTSAILTLQLENATQAPGSLSVQLTNDFGETLHIAGAILAGTVDSAVTTVIENRDAASFLSPLPEQIDILGTINFPTGGQPVTIRHNDYALASVTLEAPFEAVLAESVYQSEIESVDIDSSNIDLVTNHVDQVRFIYELENSLPVGVTADLYLARSPSLSASTHELDITGLSVPSAPSANRLATGTSFTIDTVTFSHDDVQILNTDSLYVYSELLFGGTNGDTVRLLPDNGLSVLGRFEVDYRFNDDL